MDKIEESFFDEDRTFQCTVRNEVGQLTKIIKLRKLNKPEELFFRGSFFAVTPTSARIQVQLPTVEDPKEEITEYLFRIEEASMMHTLQKAEIRPLIPTKYNGKRKRALKYTKNFVQSETC